MMLIEIENRGLNMARPLGRSTSAIVNFMSKSGNYLLMHWSGQGAISPELL